MTPIKDRSPRKTALRRARQRRRLPPGAACIFCGETDPKALEMHHVMGKAHEPELDVPVCATCHRKATEAQFREGVPLRATDNLLDRLAAILAAMACFFRFLADSLDRLVAQVKEFARSLIATSKEGR